MNEFHYIIQDEAGLHARPAGMLVKLVKECKAAVTVTKGSRTVDGGKLIALMSLGIKKGDEIIIASDSREALEKLKLFFEENL